MRLELLFRRRSDETGRHSHGDDDDGAGAPVVLFPTRIYGGGLDAQENRQYDVAPDGRFLINTVLDTAAGPIRLIQDWNPEAKK